MLKTAVERSEETGVTTVHLSGELTGATEPVCRNRVSKAVATCPVGVIVDLTALDRADVPSLGLFAAVTSRAQDRWGVPVLLCGANPRVRAGLEQFRTFVTLYEERSQALLALQTHVPRWVHEELPPEPASAAKARTLVGAACLAWDLTSLRQGALLVASELAANAIVHAATRFAVMANHSGRYLRIAVRDHSGTLPAIARKPPPGGSITPSGSGRGLWIVAMASTRCGVTRVTGGKVVWALMRTQ